MPLAPGTRFGPYEVTAQIGAGGMGEVYRATDTALKRQVAIKVLPDSFADDPERLTRLQREAEVLAQLNHPNIAQIYGLEQAGQRMALVMELVEGVPLARLIARARVPLDRVLKIAIALGDAMSAAHSRGIVHRDLKPSNVMITPDDRVKVLDFGLAKRLIIQPDGHGETALATATLTDPGLIVGTLPYMSPEQVQGRAVDPRSDIFSLGVILYELTTGQRPFKGDTNALLMSAILKDTPPMVSDITADLPRELGRIIRHCLAKDPAQRYQTVIDLRNELAELQQDLSSGSLQAALPRSHAGWTSRQVAGLATAIAVAAAVMGGYLVFRSKSSANRPEAFVDVTFEQLTTQAGVERDPSLSPDGKWVVYEGNQTGNADIYLRSVGGQNPINLTADSPDDETEPAFSPDGDSIAFRSSRQDGGIFVMGRTGESVRRLTHDGYTPAWSPDGTQIVYATDDAAVMERGYVSELWTVVVATGERRRIFEGDAVQPSWSPNGLRIAFWQTFGERTGQRDIATIPADGGTPVFVTSDPSVDWNPVWSPDGRFLFFASDRGGPMNLWRVAIDERTGQPLASPQALNAPTSSAAHMSMSADGRLIAYTSLTSSQTIQRASFDPATGSIRGTPVTVVGGSRSFGGPRPSPDGQWLTFFSVAPPLDIFVSRADGTGVRQLTNDGANDRNPVWLADGGQIAFMSNRDGRQQIWSIRSDGSGLRRLTSAEGGAQTFGVLSDDGSKMTFTVIGLVDQQFVFDPRVEFKAQTPTPIPLDVEPGIEFGPWSWSADGQELAGTALPSPRGSAGALVIYSLTTGGFTPLYESGAATSPLWLNDGRTLLFQEKSRLLSIDSRTQAVRELLSIAPDTMDSRWSITRDNRTIYFVREVQQADIWLMRSR